MNDKTQHQSSADEARQQQASRQDQHRDDQQGQPAGATDNPETAQGNPGTAQGNADSQPGPNASQESDHVEALDAAGDPSPEEQVAELKSELEEANRRLLMAQADLENFRKRVRRDYEEQIRYAVVPLIRDMLEVRDNLHRALGAAESNEQAAGLREGVAMVAKQLEDVFRKHNCRPIPAEGELFDPNFHEAISQMPSETHAAGTVAHEATRGYQLHERVVRPSQVVVSTGPAK